ncbi:MAG TPA: glutamine--tRNA ligase [Deltaproteobacteria bacterium]|nr:glutamine--tRNA ligase [Deltaproteobacteria bacterium]|tara:strand:- start:928 stop:2604 length:1677 start_codon:yes stop_codon:yes gene_type:complete
MSSPEPVRSTHFIRNIIQEDLQSGKHPEIVTRFPPEPNGYLHIGHAKSIFLNFGLVQEFPGHCFMRFDDTNPINEDEEYVQAILEDLRWLGFDWQDRLTHASDYFQKLYDFAEDLIQQGKAYVDSQSQEIIREQRGTLTEPGTASPFRERSIAENLELFRRMKSGEFADGAHVLRAKIDMASPNINLRDPVIYRIRKVTHQRTGNEWCLYPMYDYTHCLSDALEGITHSLCTLEFEDHRPLYDWVLDQLDVPCRPRQIEFSRLNLQYTVLSKRRLIQLVEEGHVSGWDDPRMPTISGLRRRGYTPESLQLFAERIGISKAENNIYMSVLEDCIREDLDSKAPRAMAVLRPLKVVLLNWPEDQEEELDAPVHQQFPDRGRRPIPMSREIFIEQDDFDEDPPEGFHRLIPGGEVRLRNAYVIRCEEVIKDASGKVIELRCIYDPNTARGRKPEGRKVKGIIHWVSAAHAVSAEVRLYDRLFSQPTPGSDHPDKNFLLDLNPNSMEILSQAWLEPNLINAEVGTAYQFERLGYFCLDSRDSKTDSMVFNRIVTLRDSWGGK